MAKAQRKLFIDEISRQVYNRLSQYSVSQPADQQSCALLTHELVWQKVSERINETKRILDK